VTAFEQYAPWYDMLYEDKDYASEASFVDEQLRRHGARPGALLDLGCGTGVHSMQLARKGWRVAGIDISPDMIRRAEMRLAEDPQAVTFRVGDVCEAGTEREFDAAVALFHVASYQISLARLAALFANACMALKPGAILLFDYWYGEAVLAQGVETRVKTVERGPLRVTRIAQSDHDEARSRVQVNYTLFCEDKTQPAIHRIDEQHRLRYWFPFEIESLLANAGFETLGHYAWPSSEPPNSREWSAYSVARKKIVP
jgi:SAM-dependent methyltransferase